MLWYDSLPNTSLAQPPYKSQSASDEDRTSNLWRWRILLAIALTTRLVRPGWFPLFLQGVHFPLGKKFASRYPDIFLSHQLGFYHRFCTNKDRCRACVYLEMWFHEVIMLYYLQIHFSLMHEIFLPCPPRPTSQGRKQTPQGMKRKYMIKRRSVENRL